MEMPVLKGVSDNKNKNTLTNDWIDLKEETHAIWKSQSICLVSWWSS